jgi:hypothetical protein
LGGAHAGEAEQELYKELVNRLTDKQYLKNIKLSKKSMLELIQLSENWKEDMKDFLDKDKISCRDVLSLCEPALAALSEEPKEGWLHYIYEYTIRQLFPGRSPKNAENSSYDAGRLFYLETLRFFLQYEIHNRPFSPRRHMQVLTEDEFKNTDAAAEYRKLLHIIQEQYIYEFMRIGSEITRHKTLAHIAGVHYICMHVGRQLMEAGVPVDIALISGSAIGHDIGKYGCKPEESKRIPYLIITYTDHILNETACRLSAISRQTILPGSGTGKSVCRIPDFNIRRFSCEKRKGSRRKGSRQIFQPCRRVSGDPR